jgi:hypothetical protein
MSGETTASRAPATKGEKKAPHDRFERGASTSRSGTPSGLNTSGVAGHESTQSSNLLELARQDPATARQLAASFAAQAGLCLTDIERELAAARLVLDRLAKERFSRKAIDASRRELRKQREHLAALKLRHQLAARKMALLEQIAGKLGDSRLDNEIDRILNRHKRLKTTWGRRYHLLSSGTSLYGDIAETPAHLSHVVKTAVRATGCGEQIGEALEQLSPRRRLADLMARTIDGTPPSKTETSSEVRNSEWGKALKDADRFGDLFDDEDPFA